MEDPVIETTEASATKLERMKKFAKKMTVPAIEFVIVFGAALLVQKAIAVKTDTETSTDDTVEE